MMKLRKSTKEDINEIMKIIKQAQDYFKSQNIDQWQNNYPNTKTIENDIDRNESYVLLKDNKIVATSMITFEGESSYERIYEGKWLTDGEKYAVIHRIAVDDNLKGYGLSGEIIKRVEILCKENNIHSIRIDTHEQNISMKNTLKKNNFKYCGVIFLADNSKRIAFEKLI